MSDESVRDARQVVPHCVDCGWTWREGGAGYLEHRAECPEAVEARRFRAAVEIVFGGNYDLATVGEVRHMIEEAMPT